MKFKGIHDETFKKGLSDLEQAKDFIKHYLPHKVVDLLSLESIRLEKDSFVDEDDKQYYADLLFSVQLREKDDAFVYVLFEHKSYKDNRILLQLLGYMVSIWKEYYKNHKRDKLPRIIPVIVYHGETKWYIPRMLSDMFNPSELLGTYLPDFEAKVVNLKTREIKGSHSLKLFLWVLKHAFDKNPIENLIEIKESFLVSLKNESFQFDLVLSYLTKIEKIPYKEAFRKIGRILNIGVEDMELMSEHFIKKGMLLGIKKGKLEGRLEGKLEGRLEGKLEGRLEAIETALEIRFGVSAISLMDKISTIDDPEKLKLLLKKIKLANSFESVKQLLA